MANKTMQKWPVLIDPEADRITPYPCQTCKRPFASCKGLREHKCKGTRKRVPA